VIYSKLERLKIAMIQSQAAIESDIVDDEESVKVLTEISLMLKRETLQTNTGRDGQMTVQIAGAKENHNVNRVEWNDYLQKGPNSPELSIYDCKIRKKQQSIGSKTTQGDLIKKDQISAISLNSKEKCKKKAGILKKQTTLEDMNRVYSCNENEKNQTQQKIPINKKVMFSSPRIGPFQSSPVQPLVNKARRYSNGQEILNLHQRPFPISTCHSSRDHMPDSDTRRYSHKYKPSVNDGLHRSDIWTEIEDHFGNSSTTLYPNS
jgi:hypothetical protein